MGDLGAAKPDRSRLHGLHDALVAGAAAQHGGEALTDLGLGGTGIGLEQIERREQHAGRAEATLKAVVLVKSLLERVQRAVRAKSLDREELHPVRLNGQHQARAGRLAVHEHGAGAAETVLAADVSPRQPEVFPEKVDQELSRLTATLPRLAVHRQPDRGKIGHSAGSQSRDW
jgi:hypothetical protein